MKERESYTIGSLELHLIFLKKITENTEFQTQFEHLLLQAIHLNNAISSDTHTITLEHSQELKFLNQQILLLLHKFIRFEEKLLEQTQQYQTLLARYENEPADSIK